MAPVSTGEGTGAFIRAAFRACGAALVALTIVAMPSGAMADGAHRHDDTGQVAQGNDSVKIRQTRLTDTLTLLSGAGGFSGGNVVASSGPDGVLLIDGKLRKMTAKLESTVAELAGSGALKFVLNTHWHYDHVGGNAKLGEDATIIAHGNVRKRLIAQGGRIFGLDGPSAPESALPVLTFEDGLSIHFNGEEIEVRHMPAGHTDGDAVVYFTASNVLHTGDLYFNGILPFADLKNGGDVESLIDDIALLLESYPQDATVVPGHGPLATMSDLEEYHRMLVETKDHVAAMTESGKSLDDIKSAGVPEAWRHLGNDRAQANWNANIHASLSR